MNSRHLWTALALATSTACASATLVPRSSPTYSDTHPVLAPAPLPPPVRADWRPLLGEYGGTGQQRVVLENGGELTIVDSLGGILHLIPAGERTFRASDGSSVAFGGGSSGHIAELRIATVAFLRRQVGPEEGTSQLQLKPVRPISDIRAEALAASPPAEAATARPFDLVELALLDSSIHLEIRYASTNNFLGTRFYDEPRAFLQRPAAEAVARASEALHRLGYGLLVHDGYRPWYVTRMFWDATPLDKRWLVANPAQGSKHNRGEAVDLTLYDLTTGLPVEMPSTYDESTDRAYAEYPGGTSQQRWHRALLRRAMVAEGFIVNPTEWWHFDYRDWRDYPIGNVPFDRLR